MAGESRLGGAARLTPRDRLEALEPAGRRAPRRAARRAETRGDPDRGLRLHRPARRRLRRRRADDGDEAAEPTTCADRGVRAAGVDLVTAITMTSTREALGIVRAAQAVGLPVVISFTVETDGRLPSGQPLGEAIDELDARPAALQRTSWSTAPTRRTSTRCSSRGRVDDRDPGPARERVPPEPRRARRGRAARHGRPRGARRPSTSRSASAPAADGARRLLRHRRPPRRGDGRAWLG